MIRAICTVAIVVSIATSTALAQSGAPMTPYYESHEAYDAWDEDSAPIESHLETSPFRLVQNTNSGGTIDGIQVPNAGTRNVQSTVIMPNTQTTVLGGLMWLQRGGRSNAPLVLNNAGGVSILNATDVDSDSTIGWRAGVRRGPLIFDYENFGRFKSAAAVPGGFSVPFGVNINAPQQLQSETEMHRIGAALDLGPLFVGSVPTGNLFFHLDYWNLRDRLTYLSGAQMAPVILNPGSVNVQTENHLFTAALSNQLRILTGNNWSLGLESKGGLGVNSGQQKTVSNNPLIGGGILQTQAQATATELAMIYNAMLTLQVRPLPGINVRAGYGVWGVQNVALADLNRPFVVALVPTASSFGGGFYTVGASIMTDINLQLIVRAVVTADRRYVRLNILP